MLVLIFHLKHLYLFNNNIKDITPLKNLNIIDLGLAHNLIENIEPIIYLNKLERLNFHNNPAYKLKDPNLDTWLSKKYLKKIKSDLIIERRKRLINLI